jgi:hypothetical protein
MFELTMILTKLRRNHDFVTTLKTKINLVRVWIDNNIGIMIYKITYSECYHSIMILINLVYVWFSVSNIQMCVFSFKRELATFCDVWVQLKSKSGHVILPLKREFT